MGPDESGPDRGGGGWDQISKSGPDLGGQI